MHRAQPSLTQLALAAVAHQVGAEATASAEAAFLAEQAKAAPLASLADDFKEALRKPVREDQPLCALAEHAGFSPLEVLSIALAAAVEQDLMAGRAVAFAQAPIGGSRPTLGLLAGALGRLEEHPTGPGQLASARAAQAGVLTLLHDDAPLAERPVAVPLALCLALQGHEASWPGGMIAGAEDHRPLLTDSVRAACRKHAEALGRPDAPVLVVRSAHSEEARAVAAEIASALKLRPFFAENVATAGLGAWLWLRRLLPVFLFDPAPGETKVVPGIPLHAGPVLALAGADGALEAPGREVVNWVLPVPPVAERAKLWQTALGQEAAALELAASHRQSAARIVQLGRLARHQARLESKSAPTAAFVRTVSRSGEGSGLASLAQPLPEIVPDSALVLPAETRAELGTLVARCRHRDGLVDGLGPSAGARYTPGVRALFIGPSGTGKTLAACWLATTLGLPLFRVDLASVTSKYIGETEKNLGRLLARAERTEAILLFDEADSLFGKRTDVRDSNDRFANAQTNYLLQRIETFDGIALLTSNSRARFDAAFSRRLDLIIEFPLPGPTERRDLWQAHLGDGHTLTLQEMNLLAGQCDFAGGQIRNVVLAAAVEARESRGPLDLPKILRALAAEYKKAGRSLPPALAAARREPSA
jgi:hypothetical protein